MPMLLTVCDSKWRKTATCGTIAAGILLIAAAAAYAGDSAAPAPALADAAPTPWLFGDWGGERTKLQNQGINFQLGYVSEVALNATGGTETEITNTDQWTAGVTLDLNKLFGLSGATFQTTFTQRSGRNLTDDANLGTLQQVQEVFGRGQTTRLTQFWFDQSFDKGLVDWKTGRMPFGDDFASFSCDFMNLTFCGADPGNLVGDYIFNWPISQWATRVKVSLGSTGYVQAGAYDVNPRYLDRDDALLPVFFSGSTGALIPVEFAWTPTFAHGSLPGSYKFGVWYDTSTADDVVDDINGNPIALTGLPPMQHHGRYGGYINFQQQVLRTSPVDPKQGLQVFLNAVFADDRTSTTDRQIAGGLVLTGPFDSRPQDAIGLAAGLTHVNGRVADSEQEQNDAGLGPVPVQGTEYAFELYYTFQVTEGLLLRPNIQYVVNPGGTDDNANALILGLKTSANF
jgi:porin